MLAAGAGGRLESVTRSAFEALGRDAAEEGLALPSLVDLYLSAAWRLAAETATVDLPPSPQALIEVLVAFARASDDAVAALCRGYDKAQRMSLRQQEAQRREFIDDLLGGVSRAGSLEKHARVFGFNLSAPHRVLVARTTHELVDAGPVQRRIERDLTTRLGGTDLVVATKDGALVCVVPAPGPDPGPFILEVLREAEDSPWQVAHGASASGVTGVAHSHAEAEEALNLARRLGFADPIIAVDSLAAYRLLSRDPEELRNMAARLLEQLATARGGSDPLIETLSAYFDSSTNVSDTARRLHLSPRAVSYRLATITRLTGLRPQDHRDRFTLEVAVLATRLS